LLLKKLYIIYELRICLQIFGSTRPNPDSANNCFVQGGTFSIYRENFNGNNEIVIYLFILNQNGEHIGCYVILLNEKNKINNEIQQSYKLCCELKLRKQSLEKKKKK
jgi:hypothetical protein